MDSDYAEISMQEMLSATIWAAKDLLEIAVKVHRVNSAIRIPWRIRARWPAVFG